MAVSEEVLKRITQLEEKFQASGQDLVSYLDGLLYSDYLTYWDYVHLDTLLSLQQPKTGFPDEHIFIMYHQVTELFFKMALHEMEQIAAKGPDAKFMIERLGRVNRYFGVLTQSYSVMVDGMDLEQFRKYRMSLLPASGFQSAQYRMIEIYATDFLRLVDKDHRERLAARKDATIEDLFEFIYWKAGATELATGKKTLTLDQFERKYSADLIALAKNNKHSNMVALYHQLPAADQQNEELIRTLRLLDINVNINWPLAHYKSAVRYLHKSPEDIAATGGTNWQKYLPPRFQKRIFYPELWSPEELENWGRSWVEELQAKRK
jgi:tryptophan 2,3-dioxygenase